MIYAQVAIPKAVPRPFIYRIPDELETVLKAGHRVKVPLHRTQSIGYVLSIEKDAPKGLKNIKEITEILDDKTIFSEAMIKLISWMAGYYLAPIGEVCRSALPPRLSKLAGPKLTRATAPHETIVATAPCTLQLNSAQQMALDTIVTGIKSDSPKPILLHGITGSGKTEIYLRAFEVLKGLDRQGLLLIPEISLTPQLVQRFKERFGDKVAVYHSTLTDAQRQDQWEQMRKGDLFAVVGTRSALFAPFTKLGLIIVDEEHDGSYKQEDGTFLYNARDSAVMRAKIEGATVVLGSATPSVESFSNATTGKYTYCYLPERATGAKLPKVEILDMRGEEDKKSTFSKGLITTIKETLDEKGQALLFLNRRGFANFLLCQACGHVFECPNCDITLTHHQSPPRLLCHYCDYSIDVPTTCPKCMGYDLIGLGKGTQKLEEELSKAFPKAKIVRLDKDTSYKSTSRKTFLSRMQKGEIDILIGTQIVAKGHDFPNVTLVGVIDADTALNLPDFRSAEKTFQILTQVAGRAGRAEKAGRVIIQTYQPEHVSLIHAKSHDYKSFFENEYEHRKALGYPPFTRLANIKFSANSLEIASKVANTTRKILEKNKIKEITLLGPAAAPLQKVRGKFRYQLLIKATNANNLARFLNSTIPAINETTPHNCRIVIDVDPINMM